MSRIYRIALFSAITMLVMSSQVGMYAGLSWGARTAYRQYTSAAQTETVRVEEDAREAGSSVAAAGSGRSEHNSSPKSSAEAEMSFRVVKPDTIVVPVEETRRGEVIITDGGESYELRVYTTLALPNDPLAGQWWEASSRLPEAWGIGNGSEPATMAIIDTGFALDHEELQDRWLTNDGEAGATAAQNPSLLNCTDKARALDKSCNLIDDNYDGIVDNESGITTIENPSLRNCSDRGIALDKSCNLVDDDANGYVDDYNGWDFATNYPSPQAGKTNPFGDGTKHGTVVAGIAAASGNNGKGIAGVNWAAKVLPLQALDDDGYGDSLTVGRAIRYAADRGVDVISLSLGTAYQDNYLRSAVSYAIGKGSIVVAAAGNDGCDCMVYPARYPEVVAVGASASDGARASFSSYGSMLDVLAPGANMTSTTWQAGNDTSAYQSGLYGTSFATPLTAGVIALLKSHQPGASSQQLIAALTSTTDRTGLADNEIRNNTKGYGLVHAGSALGRATIPATPSMAYAMYPVSAGTVYGSYEPDSAFRVLQCDDTRRGTTPLYKLSKSSRWFYSISEVERYKAQANGFSSQTLGGFCMDLPTDAPRNVRTLSIQTEFENNPNKKPAL